jgi:CspA family cold shock protein
MIMQGRVKWFDNRRGCGFILGEDGTEVYVHYTALQGEGFKSLKHNWRVSYEVTTTEDGRIEARDVKVLR